MLTIGCGAALAAAYGIGRLYPPVEWGAFVAALCVGLLPIASRAFAAARAGTPFSIETLMTIAAVGAVIIGAAEEAAAVVFLFLVGELLEGVAAFDNVAVKFTTIPLGRLEAAGIDTGPVVRRVMDLFGADRMMWGSDITQSSGTYTEMVNLGRRAVEGLTSAEQEAVLSKTGTRIYGKGWN